MRKGICRECKMEPVQRPWERGLRAELCSDCLREHYKRTSFVPGAKLVPTSALPGTDEKILVLRERVANRLPLWHPNDATWSTELSEQLEQLFGYSQHNNRFGPGAKRLLRFGPEDLEEHPVEVDDFVIVEVKAQAPQAKG